MKKILFSNIGNRNILYKGKTIEEYLETPESRYGTFKDFTNYLLENFENEKHNIQLAILDKLLDKIHHEIHTVVIFSSNQKNVERTDQDTIYAGEILVKLFSELYPTLTFINDPVLCTIYDHNQLIRTYRSKFNNYLNELKWEKVVYCDAGGTSQQKFASKIMLEYLLNEDQYEVYYIPLVQLGISTIQKTDGYEYRQVIDRENIRQALKIYAYPSALQIMEAEKLSIRNNLKNMIKFLELRFYQVYNDASCLAKNLSNTKDFSGYKCIMDYAIKKPLGNYRGFEEIMTKNKFFELCEILELSRANFKIDNYSYAILNLLQFQEKYLYCALSKLGYPLNKDYEVYSYRLLSEAPDKYPEVNKLKNHDGRLISGLPLFITIASYISNPVHQKILHAFFNSNSHLSKYRKNKKFRGLDSLRNKFAHEGKLVNINELQEQSYYVEIIDIYKIFGLPDTIVYDEMNEELISRL